MGVIDYENEMWELQPIEDLSQKMYNKQLKDITNISNTDWYKDIKRYWTEVMNWASVELDTVDAEFLKIVQMKKRIASQFIGFLDNLESAKKTRKQAQK